MEIITSAESFKKADGGPFKFSYLQLIIRKDGQLYRARCLDRKSNISKIYNMELLETKDRGPILSPMWTALSSTQNYYILREIKICELLKLHPHPNISLYVGCLSTNGRVSGICFQQYLTTLQQKVNPGHLNKSDFLSSGRLAVDDSIEACLDGVRAGIHHLHSLGIIHNDIAPSNIMFDPDGTPILIDFDSCTMVGESLYKIKRTHGWHDPEVQKAVEKNDLNAFIELQNWLIGPSPDKFLFKSG
ncbi:77982519-ae02-4e40-975c-d06788f28172 [Sclerotinia trifoliorum]|uniref:EKC/KEOPS complex subunit BUD32 n=1 Tax=Sclerotinia trifoliorum TaxID=28548 RepID=A0A8H2ZVV5_9HELO|nr:77982519-ae02-4e40-975c-d06788f28172 [Sclerotinia trifoliorum]